MMSVDPIRIQAGQGDTKKSEEKFHVEELSWGLKALNILFRDMEEICCF